ncbi:MAG: MarR family transcriptional regulator [Eubacteriales bacterium]|nr:MarR family transcriptional regulator [bacterium]MDY2793322.1 MarR family transcriptional regulator [Eubacteriales bacterium]
MLNASQLSAYSRRFADAYAAAMRPLAQETGLPQGAVDILLFLANNPGLDTARDICACRGLKPGIVSLNVENLTAGGYITRQSVPGDRRKCRLVCTPKAEPIVSRGRALQEAFFARMTEGVPHGDLEACLRCFAAFDQNLTRIAAEAAT